MLKTTAGSIGSCLACLALFSMLALLTNTPRLKIVDPKKVSACP